MIIGLLIFIAIELLSIGYFLVLFVQTFTKSKLEVNDQIQVIRDGLPKLFGDLETNINQKLIAYTKEFATTPQLVVDKKLAGARKELENIKSRNGIRCQFCGTAYDNVKKRRDGYLVCETCEMKQFGSVSSSNQ